MAQTTINDTQGVVTREAGTGTRFENNVTMTGNSGVGVDPGPGKVIGSLTLTSGGSGYTNGTYSQVALTGGSGTGATADIVVATNAVTSLVLRSPGQGYIVGDVLSCASIGAGSNFTATVATVTSVIRSDGITVASRIGGGTITPRGALDVVGGGIYDGSTSLVGAPWYNITQSYKSSLFVLGPSVPASNEVGRGVIVNQTFNPANSPGYAGFDASPFVNTCAAGASFFITGVVTSLYRSFPNDLSTTSFLTGFQSVAGIRTGVGGATTSSITHYTANLFLNTALTHTVTTVSFYDTVPGTLAATNTIGTLYGLRLRSITNSGTITNRWGISQEDSAANNVYAGKSAMGQAAGTVPTAFVDIAAGTTASAALRFRSGTAPTSPNDGDVWFDGSALKIQIGGVTKTVTVS